MISKGKNIFKGSNDLDTFSLFEERKEYKIFVSIPQEIDVWYKNFLYGKVNQKWSPYSLSESNLKQLISDKTIFVIDFVADAFKDAKNYYTQAILQKRVITQGTLIPNLNPIKGWISSNQLFHVHMEFLYNLFLSSYLIENRKEQNVYNFNDFVNEFVYFSQVQNNFPYTKSGFILSNFCSSLVSGLVIELNIEGNYSKDQLKQRFIEDPNFPFYSKIMKRYGFLIDKNIPWRIYANLNSEHMQNYAKKYGFESNNTFVQDLFDSYYYDLSTQDIEILKTYVVHFYNSFVNAYPNIRNNCKKRIIKRQLINQESINESLYWFKYYILLRFSESNKKFTEPEKYNIMKKTLELNNYVGIENALNYFNQQIY